MVGIKVPVVCDHSVVLVDLVFTHSESGDNQRYTQSEMLEQGRFRSFTAATPNRLRHSGR